MMIKLNPKIRRVARYEPPYAVARNFDDFDASAPVNEQIESLLWIPATLVSRFIGQFPFLEAEGDELFSIGVLRVCEIVNGGKFGPEKIGAVCNVQCRREMENYCNGLNSVVRVCTSTRYENRNKGRDTPKHVKMTDYGRATSVTDDHTDMLLRDAAQVLGYDLGDLTLKQKRKLAQILS